MRKIHPDAGMPDDTDPGLRRLSLLTGVLLAVLLTAFPHIALDRWGVADPLAALWLLWAMVAGFASGFGALPAWRPLRLAASSQACLSALVMAVLRMAGH
ncbi:MAG: hypothetical protein JSS57_18900 [Proteobacteria bacterium]|nr:hypothetical protein [Pseudomonadota bacterium]